MSALLAALAGCAPAAVDQLSGAEGLPREAVDSDSDWLASVTSRVDVARYQPWLLDGGFEGRNHGQHLRYRLDAQAMVVRSGLQGQADGLRVRTSGFGREGALAPVELGAPEEGDCIEPVQVDPSGACLRRLRQPGDGLDAWWQSGPEGLRQGWTLRDRPEGDGPLLVTVALDGLPVAKTGDDFISFAADGRAVRYAGVAAWDAHGRPLVATMNAVTSADGVAVTLSVEDAGAAWPLTLDPLITTSSWEIEGVDASLYLGASASCAGDLNGDGYADVVVGVPGYGTSAQGQVRVFYGASMGLPSTPDVTWNGSFANGYVGTSVDMAGDLNGDGYGDLVVGAPGNGVSFGTEGRVYIFHGSGTGIAGFANTTLAMPLLIGNSSVDDKFGFSVAGAGDTNGDGYSDIVVGAPGCEGGTGYANNGCAFVYTGTATGLIGTPAWNVVGDSNGDDAGQSVDGAGDVNGDGFADVIIGAPAAGSNGEVYVFHGGGSGLGSSPDSTLSIQGSGSEFGDSVSTAGDVNGDGYADVLVGADQAGCANGSYCGWAGLFLGSVGGVAGTQSWEIGGSQATGRMGGAVSTAGDLNGDGLADWVIGEYSYSSGSSDVGRAHIFFGASTFGSGSGTTSLETVSSGGTVIVGSDVGEELGGAVSAAGDVDGDGIGDLLIASPEYTNSDGDVGAGRVQLFNGSAAGLGDSSEWTLESNQSFGGIQAVVENAGDVNGDGYEDALVGLPWFNSTGSDSGRAYIFHGSQSGLAVSASTTFNGTQATEYLGAAVAGVGDVNGDGYADVAIGSPNYDDGLTDNGRVRVFHGSS
ncbi:MAG: FG-GAP repeat protein, partial [Deltaproteobacteria bacterium]|nr:FG-GAP repeat protein [Deltaproteobacteria bacterium]